MVDHEFRWQPERRRIKELLDEGFVGTPYSVTAVNHMGLFADPERPAYSWWQQRARGGGWLLNSGTHLIDCLRWWLGEVDRVAGFTRTNVAQRRRARTGELARVDADDAFGALLRFRAGADAVLHQSAVAVSGRTSLLEICGSDGVLLLDTGNRLLGARKGTAEPELLEIPERLLPRTPRADASTASLAGLDGDAATAALRAMELPPFVCLARELAAAIRARRGARAEPRGRGAHAGGRATRSRARSQDDRLARAAARDRRRQRSLRRARKSRVIARKVRQLVVVHPVPRALDVHHARVRGTPRRGRRSTGRSPTTRCRAPAGSGQVMRPQMSRASVHVEQVRRDRARVVVELPAVGAVLVALRAVHRQVARLLRA